MPSHLPKKKLTLDEELRERYLAQQRKFYTENQEDMPASDYVKWIRGKSPAERARLKANDLWRKKRYVLRTSEEKARRATLESWYESPLPFDETKGLQNISSLVTKILSTFTFKEQEEGDAIRADQLAEKWQEAAGKFIANHAVLISLKSGVATVKVRQPALRFQLKQMETQLLNNLRNSFPDTKITSIRFLFG